MRESRTSGSEGALGEQSPRATRPSRVIGPRFEPLFVLSAGGERDRHAAPDLLQRLGGGPTEVAGSTNGWVPTYPGKIDVPPGWKRSG